MHADGSPYAVTDYPTMRALRRGEIIQGEAMRYHNARDGQVREWRAHSAPVLAPGGEPMAAVSVFIDVDDHVRTLDALKQSEARYRSLIDLSPAIIWYGQPDGTLTFASHQLYDLTGLTPEELPPQEWPRVTHPRDLPAALDAWERARECGTLYEAEFRIRAATGAYRWFASRAAPVRDAEGTVVGWLGHNTDIDARKLAEAEAAKLAAIVEQSADFVGIADAEGRVEYVNAASRVLVGLFDEDTARAKRVADFFSPEDLPFVEAEIVSRVVSGESWVGDFIFRDFATGGPVPVHYNLFPLRAPLGEFAGFATVSRDITGRKRDEARQELLNRELSHRMKNLFALVQAIAASTLRSASDVGEARDVLAGRLVALGKAHDVLLGGAAEHAPLTDLVRQGVGVQETEGCIDYRGPDIEIGGKAALSLTLMLHELTTNAIKYGALSAPDGRVELVAELFGSDGAPDLRIAWTERGGPPVSPPARKGFGSRLIERGITAQVGGALTMDFAPEGLRCVVEAPLAGFQAGD
ncbi:PAS domain S-box-containing protein [Methylobacterium phyllostachyos]|uniref:Blue-light-activated histidine kinase n=1 Tax=Methylobacterium phyllostachyos TaxID=582672 RepID=A0A1G9U3M4_9HYPH|nr:PAS domain S-box protein [Methylobacterium phyllostachyos]SDM54254.1 PAS domain S-box-containing protein [Methylobacterium phyllostachyos]